MKQSLIHENAPARAVRHDKKRAAAKQVRIGCALVFAFCLTNARGQDQSTAEQILAQVRFQQSQQQLDLHGDLRSDATIIPFRITQTGPIIRYTFSNPPEVLQLKLGPKNSQLELMKDASTKSFSLARLQEKIGGTDVTFADLALRFLYWPNPQFISSDSVRTRACWKLRLHPPDKDAQYSTVVLWVDQESGAIMRMEAYNWQNRLAKRFEVVSAQKIDGRWFLKQMRIEAMQPGTNKVQSRSYLEIDK